MKTGRYEHVEQRSFVSWFRKTYPDVLIFAIPNGGYRSKATAAKLKVTGVTPGIPDLFIPEYGLWIEMKRANGGVVGREQKAVMEELERCGYTCRVAHGDNEARTIVQEVIDPIRSDER